MTHDQVTFESTSLPNQTTKRKLVSPGPKLFYPKKPPPATSRLSGQRMLAKNHKHVSGCVLHNLATLLSADVGDLSSGFPLAHFNVSCLPGPSKTTLQKDGDLA